MVERAERAKEVFQDQYEYELEYVFFPSCHHHLTKHTEAVSDAGFTVFGNNIWVDEHFKKHSRSSIKKQIKHHAKRDKGPIIYFNSDYGHLLDDIDVVYNILRENKIESAGLEQCLAREESEDDDDAPEQAAAGKAPTETKDSSAVSVGVSSVIIGAFAAVALVL